MSFSSTADSAGTSFSTYMCTLHNNSETGGKLLNLQRSMSVPRTNAAEQETKL